VARDAVAAIVTQACAREAAVLVVTDAAIFHEVTLHGAVALIAVIETLKTLVNVFTDERVPVLRRLHPRVVDRPISFAAGAAKVGLALALVCAVGVAALRVG